MRILIILIPILLGSCALNQSGLGQLTLVDDPFSYQNSFYPLSVGNYWKMGYYKEIKDGELFLQGHYVINVLDYTYQEIYFGYELKYLPVYRIEKQYIPLGSSETTTTYQYAIKTLEGIVI